MAALGCPYIPKIPQWSIGLSFGVILFIVIKDKNLIGYLHGDAGGKAKLTIFVQMSILKLVKAKEIM